MKSISSFLGFLAAASLWMQSSTQAALLAYESFDYPVGSLTGLNGGTGFAGAYTASGAGSPVATPGMSYSDGGGNVLAVAGNRASFIDGNVGEFRTLSSSPDALGSTLYISFIATMTNGNGYAGLSLFEGGAETMYLGKASNQGFHGIDTKTGQVVNSSTPTTTVALLVYRIDFTATPTISLFVNPGLGTEPALASATAIRTSAFTYDRIRIQSGNGATGSIDEIRIGTTYADVAPIPEPSAAVFGGGVALLGFLRRRRK